MNPIVKSICSFTKSSIGRKMIVALTGLALYLFLAGHMAGNMTVFWGPEALNAYAHHLQGLPWPFLWGFRVAMLALIAIHICMTMQLKLENISARQQYECKSTLKATLSSRTMVWTGVMIALFIAYHILQYTVHVGYDMSQYKVMLDGVQVNDVYKIITDPKLGFGNPLVSIIYIVAMILLFSHLRHGVQSVFQTVGLSTKRLQPVWAIFANLYAAVICLGMISIPLCIMTGIIK